LKKLLPFFSEHWISRATGGIVAYVAFLGVLKGALPSLLRNELLGLYSAITSLLVVICLIAIFVTTKAPVSPKARGELSRILSTWIVSGLMGIILFLLLMSPSPVAYVWGLVQDIVQTPSIIIRVHHEEGASQLISKGKPVVVSPGEKTTLTIELPPLPESLRRSYSFLATSKFGHMSPLSPYEFEYIAPEHDTVDFIVIYATNQRTGRRLVQPFNVVIQE
jgi:hypothetical protein